MNDWTLFKFEKVFAEGNMNHLLALSVGEGDEVFIEVNKQTKEIHVTKVSYREDETEKIKDTLSRRERVRQIRSFDPFFDQDGYKFCARCRTSKPKNSTNFGVDNRNKDGLTYWCRSCRNESSRKKKRIAYIRRRRQNERKKRGKSIQRYFW